MPPKQAPKDFQFREERERTFTNGVQIPTTRIVKKWEHDVPSIASLVDNGFYYTPTRKNQDQVTCFWCGKKENNIVGVRALGSHHLRTSPKCAYGLIQSNMEYYVSARDKEGFWHSLAEEGRAPKSVTDPHSKESINLRASTFKDLWKLDTQKKCTATSRDLAKAGLYYSPLDKDNDRVICMYCDCPLDHWDPEDDPLQEHKANSYAYCHFLESLPDAENKKNGVQKPAREKSIPLPDDSLDDIDDSMVSALSTRGNSPEPTKQHSIDKSKDSSYSSPLNQSLNRGPSPSSSPEPELHKESEFDAYDFSIEDIEDPDHGSIFDNGTNKVYSRKNRSRKPPPPPPASLREKRKSSLMLQVDKSHESDESTNRSVMSAHTTDQHNKSSLTSQSPQSAHGKAQNIDQITIEDDDGDDDGMPDNTQGTSDPLDDSGSNFSISDDDDSSYSENGSEVKTPARKEVRKQDKDDQLESNKQSKKRHSDSSDQSMDSDRFQQILASPGKKKKVKLNSGKSNYQPKDDILDLSGHNLGDFNESNISYLEAQHQPSRRKSSSEGDEEKPKPKPKPVLSTELSTKVKKSAFDDDDDDFDFFVQRTKKTKAKEDKKESESQVEQPNGQDKQVENNDLVDISASTDVELHNKTRAVDEKLDVESAEKRVVSTTEGSDGIPQSDVQNVEAEDDLDEMEIETADDKEGSKEKSAEEVEAKSVDGSPAMVDHDTDKKELSVDAEPADISSAAPQPAVVVGEKEGGTKDEGEVELSNNSLADTKEDASEDFVDTQAEFGDADEPTREPSKPDETSIASEGNDDDENDTDKGSDFTLSPSSYGEYVKDMRSMEDEFVDASAIQESKGGNLLIDQSSKSNLLENVDEEPILSEEDNDMVMFDERDVKKESVKINEALAQEAEEENRLVLSRPLDNKLEAKRSLESDVSEPTASTALVRVADAQEDVEMEESDAESSHKPDDSEEKPNESEFAESSGTDNMVVDEAPTEVPVEEKENKEPQTSSPAKEEIQPSFDQAVEATPQTNNQIQRIPPLNISEETNLQPISSPGYNESPHNRTFIEDSSMPEAEEKSFEDEPMEVAKVDQTPEIPEKPLPPLEGLSGSFIESSTPQKETKPREDAVYKYHNRIDATKLGNIVEELKTLKDTMEYLAEVSSASCELHNDTEGILTDFIAAMPEEEEMMTIKEWMQHNAATCGRTVKAIADRMIEAYEAEFDSLIEHVNGLNTTD
ncbi:hypothetical protein FT663_00283 [Candidozyma haemuli var. vulneris]|nr:hypothetical protein FT662_04246 [[Candida] haemuloni var. vulneris]KAF3995536.1 hypothetical protein FT663_00283 [[Candida] haemuloni var. vulneris]